MRSICVRHNFETAHRLPILGGKCTNLHGHSWWAEVTVAAPELTSNGTVAEFGAFKAQMRAWIDINLDHGAMLGDGDPLVAALEQQGSKVFVFGSDWDGAAWPTVEAVAELIADKARGWLATIGDTPPSAYIARVRVSETHVNAAEWDATLAPPRAVPAVGEAWTTTAPILREIA